MVVVEEYHHHIFIIKFFLKAHKSHPQKYSLLTGLQEAPKVLGTCLKITVTIIKKNPLASLCFIGAPTLEEAERAKNHIKAPTKRFNMYTKVVARLFSPNDFLHVEDANNSAYAIITMRNGNPHKILGLIKKMFDDYYLLASTEPTPTDNDTINVSEQFQAR